MNKVYLSLGSNMDAENKIRKCLAILKERFKVIGVSSVYKTKPMYLLNQNDFLNLCVEIDTELSAKDVLSKLKEIENELQRVRGIEKGPRTIDIDIVFFNEDIINENNLVIPQDKMDERAFVLVPLAEICQIVHPILNKSVKELCDEVDKDGVISYSVSLC